MQRIVRRLHCTPNLMSAWSFMLVVMHTVSLFRIITTLAKHSLTELLVLTLWRVVNAGPVLHADVQTDIRNEPPNVFTFSFLP